MSEDHAMVTPVNASRITQQEILELMPERLVALLPSSYEVNRSLSDVENILMAYDLVARVEASRE